jgi:subtilisin family serine protease
VPRSRSPFRATSLLAVLILLGASVAAPVPVAGAPNKVRLVVTFRPGTPHAVAERVAAAPGGSVVDRIDELNVRVVEVPAVAVAHARGRWAASAAVAQVEMDGLVTVDWTPPDPLWNNQWEQRQVRAPKAWSLERGVWTTVVAVVDTGVQLNHADLSGRLVGGWDFVNRDNRPNDDNGHGTAVAGVVAATANSIGVAGMCNRCKVMPVKALAANGTGYWTVAAKAIIWAANRRADVINLSFGGPTGGSTLRDAIAYARSKGAVVIASAGNNASTSLFYPAAFPGVLSVSASTSLDRRYSWSNYSLGWVKLAAPGCTYTTHRRSGYGGFCGTSAAAPVLSGIAALVESAKPGLSRYQIESIMTAATVRTPFAFTRYGRIDAYKAVYRALYGRFPANRLVKPSAPLLSPAAEVTLLAGLHAGYRFESSGAIIRGAGMSLAASTIVHTSNRRTIPGRSGYWFYMVDGGLRGFWVPESAAAFLTPDPTPTPTPTPTPSASPTASPSPAPSPGP